MEELRVLVSGSRTFDDYDVLRKSLNHHIGSYIKKNGLEGLSVSIVDGGAKGTDKLAEKYAKEKDYNSYIFYAAWEEKGKGAGYIRNSEMLYFAIDKGVEKSLLVAFWDGSSKGTKHMIDLASKKGVETIIVNV